MGSPQTSMVSARLAALIVAAAALGGCNSIGMSISEPDPDVAATSTNIASLTEVVQRNPSDPQAYNVRGAVLGRAGRNEEALADFNKALAINPTFAQAYANRGLVYRQMRKFDLAFGFASSSRRLEL